MSPLFRSSGTPSRNFAARRVVGSVFDIKLADGFVLFHIPPPYGTVRFAWLYCRTLPFKATFTEFKDENIS